MKSQAVQYQGKTYRYIQSVLDVFFRFHWLSPLQTKHSRGVKEIINKIFSVHGMTETLQSDNGANSKVR